MVPFKNCKFSLEETQFMAESSFISFWLPVFLFRYKVFWRNISQKISPNAGLSISDFVWSR